MRVLAGIAAAAVLSAAVLADDASYRLIRVTALDAEILAEQLEAEGFDVLEGGVTATTIDLAVSAPALAALRERDLFITDLGPGRPLPEVVEVQGPRAVPSGYKNLDQILAEMNAAAAAYPDLCEVVDLTATYGVPPTHEGRHIYAARVSDNVSVDEDEPEVLIVACHHAREIITPVIALEALRRLTAEYEINPTIAAAVNENEIWIAPVWNPDGYSYVFTNNNLWRKNRRPFQGGTGVDLNRNYPTGWSSACGGSTSPSSDTYKGPSAASEAETQLMLALGNDRHFAKVVDYHSSGREVLWSYDCLTHPFDAWWQSEAILLANASNYGNSNRRPSADGEEYEWQIAEHASYAFLIETATSFQPSYTAAQNEANMVWPGILYLLNRPIPLSGRVVDALNGAPLRANLALTGVTFTNGEKIISESRFGRYHVFAPPGQYIVSYTAPGHGGHIEVVALSSLEPTVRDVALQRLWPLGDVNCDGVVNFGDIDPFVLALGNPDGYAAQYPACLFFNADANNDAEVNFADIDPFVALLGG